ncbi:hypothetical protein U1Q18_052780 [Sarracenia purpurea var. burkii]
MKMRICLVALHTLSPVIYSSVLCLNTCEAAWKTLERKFTSLSRSHIQRLKIKLLNIEKKGESVEEYLTKIEDLTDQIVLASTEMDDEDLVLLTLNGLPEEFNSFKTNTRTRSEAISME